MIMKIAQVLFAVAILTGCSSTYEGGDENGVTVYKTIYSLQPQVDSEAVLHCKRYKKIARRLSCSGLLALTNNCTYVCDDPPSSLKQN